MHSRRKRIALVTIPTARPVPALTRAFDRQRSVCCCGERQGGDGGEAGRIGSFTRPQWLFVQASDHTSRGDGARDDERVGDQASAASQAGGSREGRRRGSNLVSSCLCPALTRTRCARLLPSPSRKLGGDAAKGVTSTRRKGLTFALRMSSERTCCGEVGAGADIFVASSQSVRDEESGRSNRDRLLRFSLESFFRPTSRDRKPFGVTFDVCM